MDRRRLGWVVVALGAALLAVSALAEPLGLGDDNGFGWKQTTGVVVGGAALVLGLLLVRRAGAGSPAAEH